MYNLSLFIDAHIFALHRWFCSIYRHDSLQQEVKIALVGKYTKLEDAYLSVIKALQHASLACRHRLSLIVRDTHTHTHLPTHTSCRK